MTTEIKRLQDQLGYAGNDAGFYAHLNGPAFSITDEKELVDALKVFRSFIQGNLSVDFEKTEIAPVGIEPIPGPDKDTPPGYYVNGVFYYNFYGHRFPKRSLQWLYLHEAVPGHHSPGSCRSASRPSPNFSGTPVSVEGMGGLRGRFGT